MSRIQAAVPRVIAVATLWAVVPGCFSEAPEPGDATETGATTSASSSTTTTTGAASTGELESSSSTTDASSSSDGSSTSETTTGGSESSSTGDEPMDWCAAQDPRPNACISFEGMTIGAWAWGDEVSAMQNTDAVISQSPPNSSHYTIDAAATEAAQRVTRTTVGAAQQSLHLEAKVRPDPDFARDCSTNHAAVRFVELSHIVPRGTDELDQIEIRIGPDSVSVFQFFGQPADPEGVIRLGDHAFAPAGAQWLHVAMDIEGIDGATQSAHLTITDPDVDDGPLLVDETFAVGWDPNPNAPVTVTIGPFIEADMGESFTGCEFWLDDVLLGLDSR